MTRDIVWQISTDADAGNPVLVSYVPGPQSERYGYLPGTEVNITYVMPANATYNLYLMGSGSLVGSSG